MPLHFSIIFTDLMIWKKEQGPNKSLSQILSVSVQESSVEVWVESGLGTEYNSADISSFDLMPRAKL